jgi:hypothetical protein
VPDGSIESTIGGRRLSTPERDLPGNYRHDNLIVGRLDAAGARYELSLAASWASTE